MEECIELARFSAYINTKHEIYLPTENPTYVKRNGDIDAKKFAAYIEVFKKECVAPHSDLSKIMLTEHNDSVNCALSLDPQVNRYQPDENYNLLYDVKNSLEALGVVTYARKYQIIYDLCEHLPTILAYLTGDDREILESRLKAKLKGLGLNYELFCKAVLSNSKTLEQYLVFDAFINLTPALNEVLNSFYSRSRTMLVNVHGVHFHPWDICKDKRKVTKFVWHEMILEMQEYLITCLMQSYDSWRTEQCMLTSKGRTNIVIQSREPGVGCKVVLKQDGEIVAEVEPKVYSNFGYIDSLIKD